MMMVQPGVHLFLGVAQMVASASKTMVMEDYDAITLQKHAKLADRNYFDIYFFVVCSLCIYARLFRLVSR